MNPTSARPDERPTKTRFTTDGDGNDVIYDGYPDGNVAEDAARWAVKRTVILADGTGINSEEWASGNRNKTHVFADRATLTYKPIM